MIVSQTDDVIKKEEISLIVFNHIFYNVVHIQVHGRRIYYWSAGQSCANYLRKVDLIYVGVNFIC